MNILITGGAGFIGINLAISFADKGATVSILDNFITSSKNRIIKILTRYNLNLIEADLTLGIPDEIREKTFEQIYHLACPTGVNNLIRLSEEMLVTCAIGTKNILDLAKEQKAKFLLASSSEVYGDPEIFPQKETYSGNVDCRGIRSPYEEGKRFAESLVTMYCRKYGLDGKIVRIFNTYGPNMSESDNRVIPKLLRFSMANLPLTVEGKGLQRRTFLYIDDLITGIKLIMNSDNGIPVFNLGSEQDISILELAQSILYLTNSLSTIEFTDRPDHDHKARMPDLKNVYNLGWQPSVNLKEGLTRTINHIKNNSSY